MISGIISWAQHFFVGVVWLRNKLVNCIKLRFRVGKRKENILPLFDKLSSTLHRATVQLLVITQY